MSQPEPPKVEFLKTEPYLSGSWTRFYLDQEAERAKAQKQLNEFWSKFDHLPSRFSRFAFKHWYIFTLGIYLLLLITAIFPLDVLTAHSWGWPLGDFKSLVHWCTHRQYQYGIYPWMNTGAVLTNVGLIGWLLGIFFIVLAYNLWRKSIPGKINELYTVHRILPLNDQECIEEKLLDFLNGYQRALYSRKRILILGVFLLFVLFLELVEGPTHYLPDLIRQYKQHELTGLEILYFIHSIVLFPIARISALYLCSFIVWSIYVTGIYISRINSTFKLNLQPSHPDRCGGLKPLGSLCFNMAIPILFMGTFLTLWGTITAIKFPNYPQQMYTAYLGTFVVVFPLAIIAFIAPLWNIHVEMVRQKTLYQDRFSDRVVNLEMRIRSHLDNKELSQAEAALQELKILNELHPDKINYPAWPFERGILFKFWSPQLFSVITTVIGIFMNLK
jgi:hypothetical protein